MFNMKYQEKTRKNQELNVQSYWLSGKVMNEI